MPRTALVCEKWPITLNDQSKGGFFKHMITNEISRKSAATKWLLADIPQAITVVEYFGGVGIQSVIIRGLTEPSEHWIFEIDQDCIDQLNKLYREAPFPMHIAYGDAKETLGTIDAELVMLDYMFTAKHIQEWEPQLTAVFDKKPRWVEISDVANRYLHLHRPLYGSILGCEITNTESYIIGMSNYLYTKYGYSIKKAAYKHTSAYFLLDNKGLKEPEFLNAKDLTKSFRYLD